MINQALQNDIRNLGEQLPSLTFTKNICGKYFAIEYQESDTKSTNTILYKKETDRDVDYQELLTLTN